MSWFNVNEVVMVDGYEIEQNVHLNRSVGTILEIVGFDSFVRDIVERNDLSYLASKNIQAAARDIYGYNATFYKLSHIDNVYNLVTKKVTYVTYFGRKDSETVSLVTTYVAHSSLRKLHKSSDKKYEEIIRELTSPSNLIAG